MDLTDEEFRYAQQERIDPKLVAEVKGQWHRALAVVLSRLSDGGELINREINYYPPKWYESHSPIAMYQGNGHFADGAMTFSVPNRELATEVYISLEAKIGTTAHEKFGHSADFAQLAESSTSPLAASIWSEWPAREQRTNLRTALLFPLELFHGLRETFLSFVHRFRLDPFSSERPLRLLTTLEVLGAAGLPRTVDLPCFYRELDEETEGLVQRWCLYTTYALTNSLAYRGERLRTTELRRAVLNYLASGDAQELEPLRSPKFQPNGALEECLTTVDLRWVDPLRARDQLRRAYARARSDAQREPNPVFRQVYRDWERALAGMIRKVAQVLNPDEKTSKELLWRIPDLPLDLVG